MSAPALLWQGETLRIVLVDAIGGRALVIERVADVDALGQPLWLPAGAVNAAELLRLLETITTDLLNLVRRQPAEPRRPRSTHCANCGHDIGVHFNPHTRCRWVRGADVCPCEEFRSELALAGGAP